MVTMNDPGVPRVAVYIDFDNIVISRYDQVHGRGQFQRDKARGLSNTGKSADADFAEKLRHLGPHFFVMRWHEMDHSLKPQWQFTQWRGRADRQGFEKIARQLHEGIPQLPMRNGRMKAAASPSRFSRQPCLRNGVTLFLRT